MMERFQNFRDNAQKKLSVADHILTQTYPLVKDPKLLLSVLENVFLSMTYAMNAMLYYERTFKRVHPFHDSFDSRFNMFRHKVMKTYKISSRYADLIEDMRNMIIEHKKSPIEFSRKDKLVICNGDYKMKTVTIDKLKEDLDAAKEFLEIAKRITSKNESIFER